MGVDNKMLYYLLPVLFRYSTASPSGDCAGIIEDWTSWMDGANWDIKADNVESTNWSIIIKFDKPLRGFKVSNGHMKQVNMTKFEITPEKYLRQHRNAIVFNFLMKYIENSPEPEIQYIKINGETHGCLGESRKLDSYGTMKTQIGRQRAGSVNSVIFSNVNDTVPCSEPHNCPSEKVSSSISCSGGTCIMTDILHISQSQIFLISDTQDQAYPVNGGWGQWGAWETTDPTTGQAKRS